MSLLNRYYPQSPAAAQPAPLSEAALNREYNEAAQAYAAAKHTNDTQRVSAAWQRLSNARAQLKTACLR